MDRLVKIPSNMEAQAEARKLWREVYVATMGTDHRDRANEYADQAFTLFMKKFVTEDK